MLTVEDQGDDLLVQTTFRHFAFPLKRESMNLFMVASVIKLDRS
jgi:hypothetical protein